jgi:hypothetical protein
MSVKPVTPIVQSVNQPNPFDKPIRLVTIGFLQRVELDGTDEEFGLEAALALLDQLTAQLNAIENAGEVA